MTILQPASNDTLNSPDHALSHRVFANDGSAPVQSIVVSSNGNVGIGTTAPGYLLDVSGIARVGKNEYTTSSQLKFNTQHGVSAFPGIFGQSINTNSASLLFSSVGGGTENTGMILQYDGNVGIGTTGPDAKMDVNGMIRSIGVNVPTTGTGAEIFMNSEIAYFVGYNRGAGSTIDTQFGSPTGGFRVLATGNVGIGTTTPTALLNIKAGTATAHTQPLQFTSGTLLTTPEAGSIEFLTDSYYGTTTTGTVRRMLVAGNTGRATAQTAANASVATYTLGATDASFKVSANVLITTSSAEAFTVTCTYTSEDNTSRVLTLNFSLLAGTLGTAIAFANGAVPYEGVPVHIRCKAGTAITIATTGTFTGSTYNVEGTILQIA